MTYNRLLSAAALVGFLSLAGCGGGQTAGNSARVSGSLTYKGQPITGANMQFHDTQGVAHPAQVSPDGTYSANDISVGELIVTVDTSSLNPAKTGAPTGAQAEARLKMDKASSNRPDGPGGSGGGNTSTAPTIVYIKLPAKYTSPKTSTLTITVKAGRQVQNIDLTD